MIAFEGMGEVAAISAAALWCVATLLYGRLGQEISPLAMNLFKGLMALVMMLATMLALGLSFSSMPTSTFLLLVLSGVAGIGLGDTLHFIALKELGARLCLLIESLAPPLTVIMAFAFLNQGLSLINLLGIVITMAGIVWVISERAPAGQGKHLTLKGCFAAFGAALCQAGGTVLTFEAFAEVEVGALWTAVIRMVAGLAALLLILPLMRRHFALHQVRQTREHFWKWLLLASFIGTFLCIWLQQIAVKHTINPGIAQTLLCASPVLILPLAAWQGERITLRASLGAVVALAGIALLMFSSVEMPVDEGYQIEYQAD